ncbi:hypothetical protein JW960_24485 [candidate division KSB1 bacterium]|nr:hypothetical protein [candidate division KSB1 bacterium]
MNSLIRVVSFIALFILSVINIGYTADLRVLAAKKNFIIANQGKAQGVQSKNKYVIVRSVNNKDVTIGTAVVTMVREKKCGLKVLSITNGFMIERGDYLRPAHPATDVRPDTKKRASLIRDFGGNTELWYLYVGFGANTISYPADMKMILDDWKSRPGMSKFSLSIDMAGLYVHVTPNGIAGLVVNGIADRYKYDAYYIQINQYLYGVSMIRYLGQNFGNGPFIRLDGGIAKTVVQSNLPADLALLTNPAGIPGMKPRFPAPSSESGFGFLGGCGWSFDFGGERLLLNANYSYRAVDSESTGTFSFSAGVLF